MSAPSSWAKPRHHSGTENIDQKNFVGKGHTTPNVESGNMKNLLGSKTGKSLMKRKRGRKRKR